MDKFLKMGKERYFGSKAILKGGTFDPYVRYFIVVQKLRRLL